MTEADAARLKAHDDRGFYEVGEGCHQFWHWGEARRASIAVFDALSDSQDVLIESSPYSAVPGKPIRGNKEHIASLLPIFTQCEHYRNRDEYPRSIYDLWHIYESKFDSKDYNAKIKDLIAIVVLEKGNWKFKGIEKW